jgi:flagellar M-ring protein FliF
MKDLVQKLTNSFRSSTPGTRLGMAVSTLVMLGLIGFTTFTATRPNFVPLVSGLDEAQRGACTTALAQGGLSYRVSPLPGPYTLEVDERDIYGAQSLIDAAGALTPPARGILTNSGSGSVFMGMRERDQVTRKREWEDCEQQLRALAFVHDANVGASAEGGPFSRDDDRTVAVTLTITRGYVLGRAQAQTVAALVSRRFGLPTSQVVIADQDGRLLYGGGLDGEGIGMTDGYDIKRRYDADMESKVNGMLTQVFGQGTAYAMVDSTWTYDTTEVLTETYDPNNKVTTTDYQRTERSSSADQSVGGPAGTSSNVETAANGSGARGAGSNSDTIDEKRSSTQIGSTLRYTQSTTPELQHLSVALVVDDSLSADLTSITDIVQAAVGFSKERGDTISSTSTVFAGLNRDDAGEPIPAVVTTEGASPYMTWGMNHGIELLAAAAFLFVLFRSLRGSRKALEQAFTHDETRTGEDQDPELVARVAVEELVHSDPEQVSAILSRWVLEQPQATASQQ